MFVDHCTCTAFAPLGENSVSLVPCPVSYAATARRSNPAMPWGARLGRSQWSIRRWRGSRSGHTTAVIFAHHGSAPPDGRCVACCRPMYMLFVGNHTFVGHGWQSSRVKIPALMRGAAEGYPPSLFRFANRNHVAHSAFFARSARPSGTASPQSKCKQAVTAACFPAR